QDGKIKPDANVLSPRRAQDRNRSLCHLPVEKTLIDHRNRQISERPSNRNTGPNRRRFKPPASMVRTRSVMQKHPTAIGDKPLAKGRGDPDAKPCYEPDHDLFRRGGWGGDPEAARRALAEVGDAIAGIPAAPPAARRSETQSRGLEPGRSAGRRSEVNAVFRLDVGRCSFPWLRASDSLGSPDSGGFPWKSCRPSRNCVYCSTILRQSRIRGNRGRSPIRCGKYCYWLCAGRSPAAMITT